MPIQRRPRPPQLSPQCNRGVTLVELLAVVAIVGILSAVVWMAVAGRVKGAAKQTQIKSDMRQVVVAVNLYRADNDSGLPYDWKNFGYYGVNKAGWHDGSFFPKDAIYSKPPEYDLSYHTPECAQPPKASLGFWLFRTSVDRYEAKRRLNPLDPENSVATAFSPACIPSTRFDKRWIHMYRYGREVAYELDAVRYLSASLSGTVSFRCEPEWTYELMLAN